MEIYVLDRNFEKIGLIDNYTSLIWAARYWEPGDCELYLEATTETLNLLQKNRYLMRMGDDLLTPDYYDMVCRIEKVELDTDAENGNYIIVKGYDMKKVLNQRVIWGTTSVDGKVEDYIRTLVYDSLVNPALSARQLKKENGQPAFDLGNEVGFTERIQEQVTYENLGDKVSELCKKYEWSFKVMLHFGKLYFFLYAGHDRSDTVIFSPDFENISSTKYIEDVSKIANVALVGGEGEGSERSRNVSGFATGMDRYELFVDAKDISRNIKWEELIDLYPTTDQYGGQGYIAVEGTSYVYKMNYIDILIVDSDQLVQLKITYPESAGNHEITISGTLYYRIYNVVIADLPNDTPDANDDCILRDLVYSVYLLVKGYESLAEFQKITRFEGLVEPDMTFKYKRDYFLGDKVTVKNEFGITAVARIIEVTEVYDDNGYNIEPKFEYAEV